MYILTHASIICHARATCAITNHQTYFFHGAVTGLSRLSTSMSMQCRQEEGVVSYCTTLTTHHHDMGPRQIFPGYSLLRQFYTATSIGIMRTVLNMNMNRPSGLSTFRIDVLVRFMKCFYHLATLSDVRLVRFLLKFSRRRK
jgi:hypothetical protein